MDNKDVVGEKRKRRDSDADPRGKRKRRKKAETLWRGWKEIYLCGTELEEYEKVYSIPWNFNHLKHELDEGTHKGNYKYCYLFGSTEPQILDEYFGQDVILVPTITACFCDVPPPDHVGIKSVMKEEEEIIPFKDLKLTWTPYYSPQEQLHLEEAFKKRYDKQEAEHSIFFLHCNLRKSSVRRMSEEQKAKYNYLLPYIFKPSELLDEENNKDLETSVSGVFHVDGRGVHYEVDFKMPNKEKTKLLNDVMIDYNIDIKHRNDLKMKMKESMDKAKERYEKKKQENLKKFNEIPKETREMMENIKVVKFYPQNQMTQDVKVRFINRYFGKADLVV